MGILTIAMLGALLQAAGSATVEEQVTLPSFGTVAVYRPEPVQRIRGVILFVSGDGGWNLGVVEMARRAAPNALVVGLPMTAWRKRAERATKQCWFPAGELETAAQAIEKIYKLPHYVSPILVGYSSGATLVYAALAQAPAEAFAGGISLGFCPELEVARAVCPHGVWRPEYDVKKRRSVLPPRPDLAPRADHAARWTALQGTVDRVCDPGAVSRFGAQIPAARVVSLPKVGHGFSVTRNWGEAYDAAIEALLEKAGMFEPIGGADLRAKLAQSPEEIRRRVEPLDLPLEILWPEGAHDAVIFISGDGGWAELDQQIAAALAARGVAVVGWNTLRYFWTARTPASFRADLGRLVGALPADVRLFLGGYSFGAEVAPVALEKTSLGESEGLDGLSRIAGLVLLAPGPYATFEVSPLDWVRTDETPTSHPVREAIEAGRGRPVLCIESAGTDDSGCPRTPVPGLTREVQPGGHHFAGDFNQIAARILEFIGAVPDAAR